MGFVTHKVKASELKAGDHIYSWRAGFIYAHHGIYVGEDRVVHFTQHVNGSSSVKPRYTCRSSSASSTFPGCGFEKSESGVSVSCLNCFMKDGSLYRYKYGVGPWEYLGKIRGGTCTTAKSDDPEAVIRRAMYLLHNGFGKYDLIKKNCEDFALYCKTGLIVTPGNERIGASGQVSYYKGYFRRLQYNAGVRDDVAKVEAEDVVAFRR